MTHMSLRTVTIDLGNLSGQIFSRTEFAPSDRVFVGRTCARRAREPSAETPARPFTYFLKYLPL